MRKPVAMEGWRFGSVDHDCGCGFGRGSPSESQSIDNGPDNEEYFHTSQRYPQAKRPCAAEELPR